MIYIDTFKDGLPHREPLPEDIRSVTFDLGEGTMITVEFDHKGYGLSVRNSGAGLSDQLYVLPKVSNVITILPESSL